MSTAESSVSLCEQLNELAANTPEAIRIRIEAGANEIDVAGVAPGLSVGNKAPDFTLPDALGQAVSLTKLLIDGPVVLTFYRGEWCPYCNVQLRALQVALPSFAKFGASLVAISPQAADHSLSLTEKHGLGFPVLSDLDQSVIRAYRLQFTLQDDLEDLQVNVFKHDPATENADHTRSLPVPATFVIDQGGVVRYSFLSANWRVRSEPAEIELALRSLAATE